MNRICPLPARQTGQEQVSIVMGDTCTARDRLDAWCDYLDQQHEAVKSRDPLAS